MVVIRSSSRDDSERVVEIWCGAVDMTHEFLSPSDRIAIDEMVCSFLPAAPLWLAVDANDRPIAFMFIDDRHIEVLFVDFEVRGVGAALVRYGLSLQATMTTDVNDATVRPLAFTSGWVSGEPDAHRSTGKVGLTR